ncbi:TrkA-C domain-containing protein [Malonomonas rubra DSM 5091]|uniref:TrkA-C domain-containing protein n=1 Tax=Malonomonas rubra DSM 5091 TaxID=1122189 RepID=A0A1M6LG30_MALRU|nr:SLC13 family permease [Malonomonas rubra]SHJ70132.1 TrkA-C domain-containing protein [Malonomonas rubra DSM 5091]
MANLPPLPNLHAIAVLFLAVFALLLFTRKNLPLETSSFIILILLAIGFEIYPFQVDGKTLHAVDFFQGFGHEALVAVCALMIAGQGIVRTGGLEPLGRGLARLWKISPSVSLLLTLILAAFISAFVNNVPIVVLLLPILISVSIRTKIKTSSVLMPMGFATLLGGTCTTIGTSTNLLVVSVAADMGAGRLEMFDFLLPGVIAAGIGISYLWLIVPRIMPERKIALTDTSPRIFTAHLAIPEESSSVGKTLAEIMQKVDDGLKIKGIRRGIDSFTTPLPSVVLKAGDQLIISDTPERLKEIEDLLDGTLYQDETLGSPVDEDHPLKADDQQVAEIAVVHGSHLQGRTLGGIRFAERYGVIILAIHRAGKELKRRVDSINKTRLQIGDILLVQGPREQITSLKKEKNILVLDATMDLPFTKKAPLALGIMLAIILTTAFGFLPIAISASCGALLMIMFGCLGWRDATKALSTQVIMIVVSSLALGSALLKTGGAEYLAQLFLAVGGDASPLVMLSGLMLLMAVLTNIVSNNATAVMGTPIAISIATQMGQPLEPFVLAVLFGANMSFATPMAYKTNLLVMNAGEYTFNDFLRIGIPLVLLLWITLSWVLPAIYGIS